MKNTNAFTLLEVLLALSILVGAVFVFSRVQVRSVTNILKVRDYVDRIYLIEKELFKKFFKYPQKKKEFIKVIENPNIKITTALNDINRRSTLKQFMDTIKIIKSDGEWISSVGPLKLKIISFALSQESNI